MRAVFLAYPNPGSTRTLVLDGALKVQHRPMDAHRSSLRFLQKLSLLTSLRVRILLARYLYAYSYVSSLTAKKSFGDFVELLRTAHLPFGGLFKKESIFSPFFFPMLFPFGGHTYRCSEKRKKKIFGLENTFLFFSFLFDARKKERKKEGKYFLFWTFPSRRFRVCFCL